MCIYIMVCHIYASIVYVFLCVVRVFVHVYTCVLVRVPARVCESRCTYSVMSDALNIKLREGPTAP